jgi:hypothetical protein
VWRWLGTVTKSKLSLLLSNTKKKVVDTPYFTLCNESFKNGVPIISCTVLSIELSRSITVMISEPLGVYTFHRHVIANDVEFGRLYTILAL